MSTIAPVLCLTTQHNPSPKQRAAWDQIWSLLLAPHPDVFVDDRAEAECGGAGVAVAPVESLTIQDTAHRFGVSQETLRQMEVKGRIPPVPRIRSGHRRYGPAELAAIERARANPGKRGRPSKHTPPPAAPRNIHRAAYVGCGVIVAAPKRPPGRATGWGGDSAMKIWISRW